MITTAQFSLTTTPTLIATGSGVAGTIVQISPSAFSSANFYIGNSTVSPTNGYGVSVISGTPGADSAFYQIILHDSEPLYVVSQAGTVGISVLIKT